jgi:hypothetical protein
MRADLNRSITLAGDLDSDPLPTLLQYYFCIFHTHHCPRFLSFLLGRVKGEHLLCLLWRRHREKAPIQRFLKVPILCAYRVVHGHKVCSGGKRSLHHQLGETVWYRGEDMAAAEYSFPDLHERGYGVVAVADEFLQVVCYQSLAIVSALLISKAERGNRLWLRCGSVSRPWPVVVGRAGRLGR